MELKILRTELPEYFDGTAKIEVAVKFDNNLDNDVTGDIKVFWDWKGDEVEIEEWYCKNFHTEGDPYNKLKAVKFLRTEICEVRLAELILDKTKE